MHVKKRIAIIIPGGIGGGHFNQGIPVLMNLIQELAQTFEITVYSMTYVPTDTATAFRIRAVKSWRYGRTLVKLIKTGVMVIKDHQRQKYDLIHAVWGYPSGILAVLIAKCLSLPSLVTVQGGEAAAVPEINYGHLLNRLKKKWLFRALYAADKVTALTNYQLEELKRHGFRRSDIVVVPYGADPLLFRPHEKERDGIVKLIHIANLTEVKDQEMLLRTFKLIKAQKDCHLRIIGADYMNGKLQQICKQLGLENNITFLGPVRHTALTEHLAWADIMLHTSLYEGQGVVVAEAALSKVLVCGTAVGLLSDLKDYFVTSSPKDHAQLAEETLAILENHQAIQEKVEKAYQWARTHSSHYTTDQFINIYNQLCIR